MEGSQHALLAVVVAPYHILNSSIRSGVVTVVGALNITGILGLPTNSVFVHVDGYFMVIFLITLT